MKKKIVLITEQSLYNGSHSRIVLTQSCYFNYIPEYAVLATMHNAHMAK